jgi:signal peptidase I
MTTPGDGRWPTADGADGPDQPAWRRWLAPDPSEDAARATNGHPRNGSPARVNGTGLNGSGHHGPGYDGPGYDGPGYDGRGLNGSGHGLNGTGLNGSGYGLNGSGHGLNGSGRNGTGVNGSGLNGSGLNGAGRLNGHPLPTASASDPPQPPPRRRGRHAAPDETMDSLPVYPGPALDGYPPAVDDEPFAPYVPQIPPYVSPQPTVLPPLPAPVDDITEVFDRPADLRATPLAPPPAGPVTPPPFVPPPPALTYPAPVFAPSTPLQPTTPLAPPPPVVPAAAPDQNEEPPARRAGRPHPGRAAVRRKRRRRRALEWPVLVVFSLLAALCLRTFVVQTFYIPSESMHDTLLEGDRVLVNKLAYHVHDINRGDVLVFRRPANIDIPDDDLIKRVIGLPGEKVEGHDRHVYINGRQLQEPYVQADCGGTADFPAVTVPTGHAFVMGDNRCDSTDSRVFGPIDTGLVVGRAFVLIWPFGRIGWL